MFLHGNQVIRTTGNNDDSWVRIFAEVAVYFPLEGIHMQATFTFPDDLNLVQT